MLLPEVIEKLLKENCRDIELQVYEDNLRLLCRCTGSGNAGISSKSYGSFIRRKRWGTGSTEGNTVIKNSEKIMHLIKE